MRPNSIGPDTLEGEKSRHDQYHTLCMPVMCLYLSHLTCPFSSLEIQQTMHKKVGTLRLDTAFKTIGIISDMKVSTSGAMFHSVLGSTKPRNSVLGFDANNHKTDEPLTATQLLSPMMVYKLGKAGIENMTRELQECLKCEGTDACLGLNNDFILNIIGRGSCISNYTCANLEGEIFFFHLGFICTPKLNY
jgi:hypothetical protein